MDLMEDTNGELGSNVISTNSAGYEKADKNVLVSAILAEKTMLQIHAHEPEMGHDLVRGDAPLTMGIVSGARCATNNGYCKRRAA